MDIRGLPGRSAIQTNSYNLFIQSSWLILGNFTETAQAEHLPAEHLPFSSAADHSLLVMPLCTAFANTSRFACSWGSGSAVVGRMRGQSSIPFSFANFRHLRIFATGFSSSQVTSVAKCPVCSSVVPVSSSEFSTIFQWSPVKFPVISHCSPGALQWVCLSGLWNSQDELMMIVDYPLGLWEPLDNYRDGLRTPKLRRIRMHLIECAPYRILSNRRWFS